MNVQYLKNSTPESEMEVLDFTDFNDRIGDLRTLTETRMYLSPTRLDVTKDQQDQTIERRLSKTKLANTTRGSY